MSYIISSACSGSTLAPPSSWMSPQSFQREVPNGWLQVYLVWNYIIKLYWEHTECTAQQGGRGLCWSCYFKSLYGCFWHVSFLPLIWVTIGNHCNCSKDNYYNCNYFPLQRIKLQTMYNNLQFISSVNIVQSISARCPADVICIFSVCNKWNPPLFYEFLATLFI